MRLFFNNFKLIFLFLTILNSRFYSQTFDKNVFIDLPGENYDFDLLPTDNFQVADSYITWINKNESNYTVYLKKISPVFGENLIISSDANPKSNPHIAINKYGQGIKIVWQTFFDGNYQILLRNFANDSLSNISMLRDSINYNPQISLSINRVIWIENGNLMERKFYPSISNTKMIDSTGCSSPDIFSFDESDYAEIVYEKSENGKNNISFAEYGGYPVTSWKISTIDTGKSFNPNFGMIGTISFEKIVNGVSKIVYGFGIDNWESTNNQNCNYLNPTFFSYPIPTKSFSETDLTPYFITFDSDSILNNREIFYKTVWDYGETIINISNMEGDDFNSKVELLLINDTIYVAIFWEHQTGTKTDIWMATTKFNPIINDVKNESQVPYKFILYQNFPNPFNPSTTIKYSIPQNVKHEMYNVKLIVYDVLGREVETLVNEVKPSGNYEVKFNAEQTSGLSSGVYLYQLQSS